MRKVQVEWMPEPTGWDPEGTYTGNPGRWLTYPGAGIRIVLCEATSDPFLGPARVIVSGPLRMSRATGGGVSQFSVLTTSEVADS